MLALHSVVPVEVEMAMSDLSLTIAGAPDRPRRWPGIIGRSRSMLGALSLVERACNTAATVLLTGETGTGKEVIAQAIHQGSERGESPFVAVNCAAFPDTLLESELFGHVKGAFTGAERAKEGLFQLASGGTLFLDEVGETALPLQAKLLRVLQEREVRALGGNHTRKVDVRVVAATNRELQHEISNGRFRADLFYRLAVFPIRLPALQERREDVLPLADHFLHLHGKREGRQGCELTSDARSLLVAHSWPGNVRELENAIQRALALVDPGEAIGTRHLALTAHPEPIPPGELGQVGESLRETLMRVEAFLLHRALEQHGGQRSQTAASLGITREGLYKKMKRLGIE
jgi:transcriptional regulator with PAS, ATPase and Fis domain